MSHSSEDSPQLQGLARPARRIRLAAAIVLGLAIAGVVVTWIFGPFGDPEGTTTSIRTWGRWGAAWPVTSVQLACTVVLTAAFFVNVERLFRLVGRGEVLTAEGAVRLRRLGWTIVAVVCFEFLDAFALSPLASYLLEGHPEIDIELGFSLIMLALAGLVLVGVARAVNVATELAADAKLTI